MNTNQHTGVCKWFDAVKGFGFIIPDDGSGDVFVHISAVERAGMKALREGEKIIYDLETNPKNRKICAVNLRKAA